MAKTTHMIGGHPTYIPNDPVQAARAAVEAIQYARDCLKVSASPRTLERVAHALSSAKGAVRAAEYRKQRYIEQFNRRTDEINAANGH